MDERTEEGRKAGKGGGSREKTDISDNTMCKKTTYV